MSVTRLPAVKVRIASILAGHFFRGQQEMEPSVVVTPGGTTVSRARVLATVVSRFLNDDGTYASVTLDDGSETIRAKAFREDVSLVKGLVAGDTVDLIGRVREYEGELYLAPELVLRVADHNWELVRRLELLREDARERRALVRAAELRSQGVPQDEIARRLAGELGLPPRAAEAVLAGPVERRAALEEGGAEDAPAGATRQAAPPSAGPAGPAAAPPGAPAQAKPPGEAAPNPRAVVLALIQRMDKGEGVPYVALRDGSKLGDALDDVLGELIAEGEIFEPRTGKYKRLD